MLQINDERTVIDCRRFLMRPAQHRARARVRGGTARKSRAAQLREAAAAFTEGTANKWLRGLSSAAHYRHEGGIMALTFVTG
jgi:hypothetical protein